MISRAKTGKDISKHINPKRSHVESTDSCVCDADGPDIPRGPPFAALESKVRGGQAKPVDEGKMMWDIPRGPAFAALESKVRGGQAKTVDEGKMMSKTPDSSNALDYNDLCILKSRLAETVFENDRTEVSSAATLMSP